MGSTEQLQGFVADALRAGRTPDQIDGALRHAGWGDRERADALAAWVPMDGMPPIPRPTPYVSAVEALIYGLLFLLLGVICWHVASLGFRVIEMTFPDPIERWGISPASIRWSVATLIPTLPAFLWLNRRVARSTRADPGRRRSLVRKWFASITMLLAALALLGDVVAVVYAVLSGDLTVRFVAKAALVAVLGGLAFAYYRDELNDR